MSTDKTLYQKILFQQMPIEEILFQQVPIEKVCLVTFYPKEIDANYNIPRFYAPVDEVSFRKLSCDEWHNRHDNVIVNVSDGSFTVILPSGSCLGQTLRCVIDNAFYSVAIFKEVYDTGNNNSIPFRIIDTYETTNHICYDLFGLTVSEYIEKYLNSAEV